MVILASYTRYKFKNTIKLLRPSIVVLYICQIGNNFCSESLEGKGDYFDNYRKVKKHILLQNRQKTGQLPPKLAMLKRKQ